MEYKQSDSGILVPKSFVPDEVSTKALQGRSSVINPQTFGSGYNTTIAPDAEGRWSAQRVVPATLAKMKVSDLLRHLVRSSDAMKRALTVMKRYLNTKYELDASDDSSKASIQDFIYRMELTGKTFGERVDEDIYNMIIEGAYSREVVYDSTGNIAVDSVPVSPMSLRYMKLESELYREKTVIFQRIKNKFVILHDPEDPILSQTFAYYPVDKIGHESPLGNPPVTPAIFGILSKEELMRTVSKFIQGQIMPTELITLSRDLLAKSGYDTQSIDSIIAKGTAELEMAVSGGDSTRKHIVGTDLSVEQLGVMGNVDFQALRVLFVTFDYVILRGLDIPKVLFQIERTGGGLSNNESDVEYNAFQRSLEYYRNIIESMWERQFIVVLRNEGSVGTCRPMFDATDTESTRILSETFNVLVTGLLQVLGAGIFSATEVRGTIIRSDSRFKEFDLAIPTDAVSPSEASDTDENTVE